MRLRLGATATRSIASGREIKCEGIVNRKEEFEIESSQVLIPV